MLAGGLLTACSGDEPNTGNGELNAVRVSAGINTAMSRANGAEWEADDIGVSVINAPSSNMADRYRNVRYKTDATGASAQFTPDGNDGIFFQDASETVTFSAYGPYRDWAVAPGDDGFNEVDMSWQLGREAQKSVDFIYATGATASNAQPEVAFSGANAFRHVMSRLVVTIKISDKGGFSDNALTDGNYYLGGMKLEALFNPYTGEAKASDKEAVDGWRLNNFSVCTDGAGTRTYSTILPPQTLDNALTFTAEVDGQTYTNSSLIKPALESGKSYQYTITVSKTGLTVSGCTITDWTVGSSLNGDATMPVPAKKGDFFYSDGTYSSSLNPDKTCIGIVFWTPANANPDPNALTPASLSDDKIMNTDFPDCTHGLVVALNNAAQTKWANGSTCDIFSTFQNTDNFSVANMSKYRPIASTIDAADGINYILGYQNTRIMKAYKEWNDDPNLTMSILDALESYSAVNPAPKNTTGWYIPSLKELSLLISNDHDDVYKNRGSYQAYFINDLLATANGTKLQNALWSSTELLDDEEMVFYATISYGDIKYLQKAFIFACRPVLAF